jgi:hypothetical protein
LTALADLTEEQNEAVRAAAREAITQIDQAQPAAPANQPP